MAAFISNVETKFRDSWRSHLKFPNPMCKHRSTKIRIQNPYPILFIKRPPALISDIETKFQDSRKNYLISPHPMCKHQYCR